MIQNSNGFDVRFQYDNAKLKPSSLETNELTEDETEYFKFEDEFAGSVELFTLPEGENIIRAIESFFPDPPLTPTEHIQQKEDGKFVINTSRWSIAWKNEFPNDNRR